MSQILKQSLQFSEQWLGFYRGQPNYNHRYPGMTYA